LSGIAAATASGERIGSPGGPETKKATSEEVAFVHRRGERAVAFRGRPDRVQRPA